LSKHSFAARINTRPRATLGFVREEPISRRQILLRLGGMTVALASTAILVWTGLPTGIPEWLVWVTSSVILMLTGFEAGVFAERIRVNRADRRGVTQPLTGAVSD
jgi:hypothetical protein